MDIRTHTIEEIKIAIQESFHGELEITNGVKVGIASINIFGQVVFCF